MPYCELADLTDQIPESNLVNLTDDIGADVVDEAVTGRAIADADSLIDSYLQGRYSVPLTPVPVAIRRLSVTLTIYNLFKRRNLSPPEIRATDKQDAIRFLEQVAAGKITLGAETPQPESSGSDVRVISQDRIFSRDTLVGF